MSRCAVEINLAVNQSFLHDGVDAERIVIVDGEIGVLADVNGTGAVINAQLNGGIQSDQLQRVVRGKAAELHALGGFLIELARFLGVVGIDGNDHAALGHQRGVVGNGVVRLHFVSPPIGKRGAARAGCGDLVGDFVTFQDVLEGADFEAEFIRDANEHQDFIGAIAVGVDVALAFEDFNERIEADVAARRNEILFAGCVALVVIVPLLLVFARFDERLADDFFDAQPAWRDNAAGHRAAA